MKRKNRVEWSDLVEITWKLSGYEKIEKFSEKVGIPVEKMKHLVEGTKEPELDDIDKLKATSDDAKRLIEIFQNKNVTIPYLSETLAFWVWRIKQIISE